MATGFVRMKPSSPTFAAVLGLTLAACTSSGNPHPIDETADIGNYQCYAAVHERRSCKEGFASVSACNSEADATLLEGGLQAGRHDGCYYFCPDVPNCETLTMEQVAELACKYAARNGINPSLSLRSLCGPELDTGLGSCCYGIDAVTLYE